MRSIDEAGVEKGRLTVVNASGRKNMLTNVSSLTFSPSLVDALLSMTALALKSYQLSVPAPSIRLRLHTASLKAFVNASFCLNNSRWFCKTRYCLSAKNN